MEEWHVKEPWLPIRCQLGEGPFYEKETDTIRFVDIITSELHTVSLKDGPSSLKTVKCTSKVSVTADIDGVHPRDRILVGSKYGPAILARGQQGKEEGEGEVGALQLIARFGEPPSERIRANEGACDPHGRFWLGTMTDFGHGDFQPEGSLYRFGPNNTREEILRDLTIPNAICWSPDRKTMYFTQTEARTVFAMDYDLAAAGAVSNKRVFYRHDGPGLPDGCRVDVHGNLWHAVYGGSRVLKISPDGDLLGQVVLPARNITCVQFAGTELVITSAADGEDEGDEPSRRWAGAVFKVDVGVEGLELFKYKP